MTSSPARKGNPRLADSPLFSTVSSTRLKSVYSDISRQKTSNPAAYSSNVQWWKRTLTEVVAQGLQASTSDVLVLHAGPELLDTLRYDGIGKPLGLASVIVRVSPNLLLPAFDMALPGKTELRDSHSLIPLDDFMNATTSIYDRGSLAYRAVSYALGKPLWWALEQLSLVDSDRVESESSLWKKVAGKYVVLENVEKAADAVVSILRHNATLSSADSLYSFEAFRKRFGVRDIVLEGIALTEADLRILVKFLDRDRGAIVSDGDAIKVVASADIKTPRSITSLDKGILELKTAVENMEQQVELINNRISEKTQRIKDCLGTDRKDVAVTHLKSRKLYEDTLRKRLGSLEVLQSTLIQVETAAQDLEVMRQYESSTATLRSILSHPSLQRGKIDATMDAMAEAHAEQREIDEAIRTGIDAGTASEDEDAIEAELAGLVAEIEVERKEKEESRTFEAASAVAGALPSVPPGTPAGADACEALTEPVVI